MIIVVQNAARSVSVQPGVRRHGNAGTHGNYGNVVAVSYGIYRR
jgi:hypothetical protein